MFDQGSLGSCTANAISTAFIYNLVKQEESLFVPSRLFIYYNTRLLEGNEDRDSGATLRNTVKSINKVGLCEEPFWPYDIKKFKSKPSTKSYDDAEGNKAVKYERLSRSLYDFKSCLAAGLPFVCGFAVYESFQSKEVAKTGIMPMPGPDETSLGGHAILVVGYDDETQCFIVRNSWGTKWGDKGHFYMPYEYLLNRNLSDDFWVIQKVIS
jgi:C1A family cysteine protease